jgi:cytochrome c553
VKGWFGNVCRAAGTRRTNGLLVIRWRCERDQPQMRRTAGSDHRPDHPHVLLRDRAASAADGSPAFYDGGSSACLCSLPWAPRPRLAGKPAGYLLNQLVAFRDGRRRYPPMNYLLEYLPETYLRQMAEYLAALRPPPPPQAAADVSPTLLARGRELVMEGDAGKGVPACARCHGPTFTGMEPAIPGLVGLHASYISAQLGAWRYGTRTAAAPDCMQIIAATLTENDVSAVAAWLASLPVPSDPSPVARGTLSMPLPCGSEPN